MIISPIKAANSHRECFKQNKNWILFLTIFLLSLKLGYFLRTSDSNVAIGLFLKKYPILKRCRCVTIKYTFLKASAPVWFKSKPLITIIKLRTVTIENYPALLLIKYNVTKISLSIFLKPYFSE